ncbi:riboflavin synthase subunit beta [Aequorivita echinoideorum]|uniref:Riboflavin synthase subunit beta n=1 Tax=Aequorivita echinoideorum TaxID=1549647 RepID=A0ABS5S5R6_9FLAO|nr:riboflavin synthase subunit beta [Aequorivita echinoideorum]MBT0608546.1 riboflavin synthase subunit beta [Aequorivita echinoideorum]
MGIISKRKNKKFSYKPRHFEHDGESSPFAIEHKFDKFRTTVGDNKGLKGKFKSAWEDLRRTSDKNANIRLLIIIGLLVLFFLYIIGFDLSIFHA